MTFTQFLGQVKAGKGMEQLEASRCTHIKCCGALFKVSQENAGLRKAMKSYEVRLAKDLARLSGQR